MTSLRIRTSRLLISMITMILIWAVSSAAFSEEVTIRSPTVDGYRLDWCRDWAKNCGKPAADRYCQLIGHERSTNHRKANNIGHITPTKVVNSNQVCREKECDGFKYVGCKIRNTSLGNPKNHIPKKQKTPDPVLEDGGKADSGFSHTSAANVLQRYDILADGAVRAIANNSSGVNASELISTIENQCVDQTAACHLELKLKFLQDYLSQ